MEPNNACAVAGCNLFSEFQGIHGHCPTSRYNTFHFILLSLFMFSMEVKLSGCKI